MGLTRVWCERHTHTHTHLCCILQLLDAMLIVLHFLISVY
jgi:hypothetical protein